MRDYHALERQLQQRSEGRQRVDRGCRPPHLELAAQRGEGIREHDRLLLGQPDRRLDAVSTVVEREEVAGETVARIDRLEVGDRQVVTEEEPWPVGPAAIASDEQV